MVIEPKACLVCAAPLQVHRVSTGLCGNVMCDWKFRSTAEHQRCAICKRPLAMAQLARGCCSNTDCEHAWLFARPMAYIQEQINEQQRRIQAAALHFYEELTAKNDGEGAFAFPVVVIPYTARVAVPLPLERREALRAHVANMVSQALAVDRDAWVPSLPLVPPLPDVHAVMVQACMACRGACCGTGGNHAYVTRETMLGYVDQHPGSTADEIAAVYVSHLPHENMEDGCVFQHTDGCTLPRNMRSVTCNEFYCRPLVAFRNSQGDTQPVRAFFVPEQDGRFDQGLFVTPELVQVVRRSMPASQNENSRASCVAP